MSNIVQRAKDAVKGVTGGKWLVNPFRAQVDVGGIDAPICQMLWPTKLRSEDETEANARFIAFAREGVPALSAECERLLAENEALRAFVQNVVDASDRPDGVDTIGFLVHLRDLALKARALPAKGGA